MMHDTCSNLEDGEKEYLRGQLLQLILEEDNQVSLSLIWYMCHLPSWHQVHTHISQALEVMAVQNPKHHGSCTMICMLWHILVVIDTCTCSCILGLLLQHVPPNCKLSSRAVVQIAVQMAVVFAKIARIDYPKAWPGLFTDLLQQLQSQSTLVVRRVYLVLHHALKELASKRLGSDQRAFAEVIVQSPLQSNT